MISPGKFTKSMAWEPWKPMSAYIKEIESIRGKLIDTIFYGEFIDAKQIRLKGTLEPAVRFSVSRNLKTGKRACILTNDDVAESRQTILEFNGNTDGPVRIYRPFEEPVDARLPAEVVIRSEGITFVVEQ